MAGSRIKHPEFKRSAAVRSSRVTLLGAGQPVPVRVVLWSLGHLSGRVKLLYGVASISLVNGWPFSVPPRRIL